MNESTKLTIEIINAVTAVVGVATFLKWAFERTKPLFSKQSSGQRRARRIKSSYAALAETLSDRRILAMRLFVRGMAGAAVLAMAIMMVAAGLHAIAFEPRPTHGDTLRGLLTFFLMAGTGALAVLLELRQWLRAARDPDNTRAKAAAGIARALERGGADKSEVEARLAVLPRIPKANAASGDTLRGT